LPVICDEEVGPSITVRVLSIHAHAGASLPLTVEARTRGIHRGIVLGRCEKKTGIKPFGLLVDQVLERDPYKDAAQLFFIVDNGSSHRGQASVQRMRR
jgi:hypothetical protein